MKTVLTVYYFLIKKHLIFINSPLQLICCMEYLNKFKNNFYILFAGYSKEYNIESIKEVEKFYKKRKNKFKIIYLNEILNIYIFHFILNLRKYFFLKFETVLIGDYRYYLHRKIFSISKKTIFVDDGFGSLWFNRFFRKRVPNSVFFTAYPLKYNVSKTIENNFEYLKSLYKVNKKQTKSCFFLLPGLSEKKILENNQYFKWIYNIKNKIKGSITIIPHRIELDLINNSDFLKSKFSVKVNNLPIELSLIKSRYLPRKIIHSYSSCAITLNKIFGNKVEILNYRNKQLESTIDSYNKGTKPNETIIPMKRFLDRMKFKSIKDS